MPDYLHLIDTTTSGRYDVTPLFADGPGFHALLDDLIATINTTEVDVVAGIDALGFILGAAIATRLHIGFVPIRKAGKLPGSANSESFIDYTGTRKTLELRAGQISAGQRVLLVDEWIETGSQVAAGIALIERQGGVIVAIMTINVDDNPTTRSLRRNYRMYSVMKSKD